METWKKCAPAVRGLRGVAASCGSCRATSCTRRSRRRSSASSPGRSAPQPGEKPVPIMLAIAAVTLSTMHQSSLGSLFLLMPDKLDPAWWSPVMPVYFFLSAIAAGTALMVLVEMWIAKGCGRQLRMDAARVARARSRSGRSPCTWRSASATSPSAASSRAAFTGPEGGALPRRARPRRPRCRSRSSASAKLRENPRTLFLGALLAVGGVILNRVNVVVFAMDAQGRRAADRAAGLLPERRRVGRLDRPDRRDHLPVRPGGPAHAGPREAGGAGGSERSARPTPPRSVARRGPPRRT